jgi:cold shock CspA family protein
MYGDPTFSGCAAAVRSGGSRTTRAMGRLTVDDGEVPFVHLAAIQGGEYRTLREGQRVSFVWSGGIQDHGRHRAEDIIADE